MMDKTQIGMLKKDHCIVVVLKALEAARRALADWDRTYSPTNFTEPQLSETHDRLKDQGVTEYINAVQTLLAHAIELVSETIALVPSNKVWQVTSATQKINGVEIEKNGLMEMVEYDTYIRLLHDVIQWERWSMDHVWITNQEYVESCRLKQLYGNIPLPSGSGETPNPTQRLIGMIGAAKIYQEGRHLSIDLHGTSTSKTPAQWVKAAAQEGNTRD